MTRSRRPRTIAPENPGSASTDVAARASAAYAGGVVVGEDLMALGME